MHHNAVVISDFDRLYFNFAPVNPVGFWILHFYYNDCTNLRERSKFVATRPVFGDEYCGSCEWQARREATPHVFSLWFGWAAMASKVGHVLLSASVIPAENKTFINTHREIRFVKIMGRAGERLFSPHRGARSRYQFNPEYDPAS